MLPVPGFPMDFGPVSIDTEKTGLDNIDLDYLKSNPLEKKELTEEEKNLDFSGKVPVVDFLQYNHQLRSNYNKLGVRVDFTETILFVPMKPLKGDGNIVKFETDDFFLSDQVTQFQINVDLMSTKGRLGFAKKTFTSALPLYARFNLPKSMVIGDKLNIPFTIYSAMDKAIDFDYLILERELSEDGKIRVINSVEVKKQKLDAKGQKTIAHTVDSSKSSLKGNKGMIYLQISLKHEGQVKESVIKGNKVSEVGFSYKIKDGGRVFNEPMRKPNQQKFEDAWTFKLPETTSELNNINLQIHRTDLKLVEDIISDMTEKPTGCFEQTSSSVAPQIEAYATTSKMIENEKALG